MSEIVSATEKIAGAIDGLAKVADKPTALACDLLRALCEPGAHEIGASIVDWIRARRVRNLARIAAIAKGRLQERNLLNRDVSPQFLLSAASKAADVDDPDLQEL